MTSEVEKNVAEIMNLSFCGGGFLGIYHLGVATCLVRHGREFLNNVHRFAGASSGSLVAALMAIDIERLQDCLDFTIDLAGEVAKKPLGALTPRYNLMKTLEQFLNTTLPSDAHERASGKLFVSLTNLRTRRNELKSDFGSKQELVQSLIGSSFIPLYGGTRPPVVKGKKFIDGGLTNNLPVFDEGTTVTVSPFSGYSDICPLDYSSHGLFIHVKKQYFQVTTKNLVRLNHALFPPSRKLLLGYYYCGQRDTIKFLEKEGWFNKKASARVLETTV